MSVLASDEELCSVELVSYCEKVLLPLHESRCH